MKENKFVNALTDEELEQVNGGVDIVGYQYVVKAGEKVRRLSHTGKTCLSFQALENCETNNPQQMIRVEREYTDGEKEIDQITVSFFCSLR